MFKMGLVIGKFYPPHKGHSYLIDTALAQSEKVTVIVCDKPEYFIPGNLRAKWIKQIHPRVKVILINDTLPDDDSEAWAKQTIKILGSAPDAVFTSEDYGDPYSQYMGSVHIQVDKARVFVPISGTKVRDDPLAAWDFLHPEVRVHFIKRICVIGAESTGTTTLSKDLAKHFQTSWVPEYGRIYSEGKLFAPHATWSTNEFVHIAGTQNKLEDQLAKTAHKLLICDTNSFATAVWHERYMDYWSDEVREVSEGRRYDLYILTGDEIPFVQDGTRDGEHIRHQMHDRFKELLDRYNMPHVVMRGSKKERLDQSINVINALLKKRPE